jgi:uncharacterized protein (TIGR03084 family)
VSDSAYHALLDDLGAEEAALDEVVAYLDESGWTADTPAAGWNVENAIAHLAATEEWATIALAEPDRFRLELAAFAEDPDQRQAAVREGTLGRTKPQGVSTLEWWRSGRQRVGEALAARTAKDRLPWFGPDMSAMSFATARLMENWAHGRDVCDGLGIHQPETPRLRHVAEIGVRTRGWSYVARGLTPPDTPVRVELTGPEGEVWVLGDTEAEELITGSALDFALVVTQRMHPDDTALEITGNDAREWISHAQAFAGAATEQRPPSRG